MGRAPECFAHAVDFSTCGNRPSGTPSGTCVIFSESGDASRSQLAARVGAVDEDGFRPIEHSPVSIIHNNARHHAQRRFHAIHDIERLKVIGMHRRFGKHRAVNRNDESLIRPPRVNIESRESLRVNNARPLARRDLLRHAIERAKRRQRIFPGARAKKAVNLHAINAEIAGRFSRGRRCRDNMHATAAPRKPLGQILRVKFQSPTANATAANAREE